MENPPTTTIRTKSAPKDMYSFLPTVMPFINAPSLRFVFKRDLAIGFDCENLIFMWLENC
jgi:hypothetical protein